MASIRRKPSGRWRPGIAMRGARCTRRRSRPRPRPPSGRGRPRPTSAVATGSTPSGPKDIPGLVGQVSEHHRPAPNGHQARLRAPAAGSTSFWCSATRRLARSTRSTSAGSCRTCGRPAWRRRRCRRSGGPAAGTRDRTWFRRIKANPCEGIRLPRAEAKEPIFLTPDQVEMLARAARPPYGVLIRFAAATGLSPARSAACGCVGSTCGRDGRGGRGPHRRRRAHRGRAAQERVPEDRAAPGLGLRQLRDHLSLRATEAGRPLTGDDYVFTAPEGGPLRRDLLHKRIFRPAVIEAGLPGSLRMHDLRHTCTSILIALGAHPKVIQEMAGAPVDHRHHGRLRPPLSVPQPGPG